MNNNRYGNAVVDFGKALQPSTAQAFFSTRLGGVSTGPYASLNLGSATGDCLDSVDENFKRLRHLAGNPTRWLRVSQVHGNGIVVDNGELDGLCGEADGLVSRFSNVALSTYHADCYPIYMTCCSSGVIGLAHAGWQGVRKEIGGALLSHMLQEGAVLESIRVVIGPGISGEVYRVSESLAVDFSGYFGEEVVLQRDDGPHLDLVTCIVKTIVGLGVAQAHITCSQLCTYSDEVRFFSHRRDGARTGRMMAVMVR